MPLPLRLPFHFLNRQTGSSSFPPHLLPNAHPHGLFFMMAATPKGPTSSFLCLKPSMAPQCFQEQASAWHVRPCLRRPWLASLSELHFSYLPSGTLPLDSSAFSSCVCSGSYLEPPSPASGFLKYPEKHLQKQRAINVFQRRRAVITLPASRKPHPRTFPLNGRKPAAASQVALPWLAMIQSELLKQGVLPFLGTLALTAPPVSHAPPPSTTIPCSK